MQENVIRLFDEPALPPAPVGDFEAIWKLWPNKAKKLVAKAKYEAILRGGFRTRTLDKDSGQYVELELAAPEDAILNTRRHYRSRVDHCGKSASIKSRVRLAVDCREFVACADVHDSVDE